MLAKNTAVLILPITIVKILCCIHTGVQLSQCTEVLRRDRVGVHLLAAVRFECLSAIWAADAMHQR